MIGALGVGHLLHTDPFVVGPPLAEALGHDVQAQVAHRVWLRVHSSDVLWVHCHSGQRYGFMRDPILDAKRRCLADETPVHRCRNCGLGKERPHSQAATAFSARSSTLWSPIHSARSRNCWLGKKCQDLKEYEPHVEWTAYFIFENWPNPESRNGRVFKET